jgi:hypothetical protein
MASPQAKSSGPTTEENRMLIKEIDERTVAAIRELKESQKVLFGELKESEKETAQKNRWIFGVMSSITMFIISVIGIPLLLLAGQLKTDVAILKTQYTLTGKMEAKIEELEKLVNTIDKRTD